MYGNIVVVNKIYMLVSDLGPSGGKRRGRADGGITRHRGFYGTIERTKSTQYVYKSWGKVEKGSSRFPLVHLARPF